MNIRKFLLIPILALGIGLSGCTRITTGEVGLRIDASRQVQSAELMPGSWNQTMVGGVITFPVKDIAISLDNKAPLTADNSALADFDITLVYGINPTSVAELYNTKSKSFHYFDEKSDDTYLMYNYITTLVNNAAYKTIRGYKALEVADKRAEIEANIRSIVTEQLKIEKLDSSIQVTVVQVRNIAPNADILKSSTDLVKASNELAVKEKQVEIAKKEAQRMEALAVNGNQSIQYMEAQAKVMIAEAVRDGKVKAIIIPSNMTSLMIGDLGK